MTFVEWYLNVLAFFQKHDAPVFIHGSTLLNATRGAGLAQRHTFDNELNFGIRARDLTQQLIWDMKKEFPYVSCDGNKMENALIYFGPEPIIDYHSVNKSQWDMEPGFALLATFWEGKNGWYEYMGHDICLEWPKFQLETFSGIDLAGRRISAPAKPGEWLEHYFGEDFMEENLGWHWIKDSHNRKKFSELREAGEI